MTASFSKLKFTAEGTLAPLASGELVVAWALPPPLNKSMTKILTIGIAIIAMCELFWVSEFVYQKAFKPQKTAAVVSSQVEAPLLSKPSKKDLATGQ